MCIDFLNKCVCTLLLGDLDARVGNEILVGVGRHSIYHWKELKLVREIGLCVHKEMLFRSTRLGKR